MKKYDIAVLDFETMNNNSDSPCEVGISLIRDLEIVNEYHSYINPPNNEYSLKNAKIHNISKECISNAPSFNEIYPEIKNIIKNVHIVIAHNAHFDVSVLKSTLNSCELEQLNYIYTDSINICKYFLGNIPVSMDSLCDLYNINKDGLHSAKYDSRVLSAILLALAETNGFNSILELIQSMKNQYIKFSQLTKIQTSINKFSYNKTSVKTTEINKNPVVYKNEKLNNKIIVFTGEFDIQKAKLMLLARKNGAIIKGTVTSKTNILIEGEQEDRYKDENGLVSKQRKARELINNDIPIHLINERELLDILEGDIQ